MNEQKRRAANMGVIAAVVAAAAVATLPAHSQDDAPAGFTAISPIFGQLVAFTQPAGFVPAFEQPTADRYIREAVPKGETSESWTQMVTVTGAKGLASAPDASPEGFAGGIAAGFEQACPETFTSQVLSRDEIDGHAAFVAVASCGSVGPEGATRSETALIVAIAGEKDYYTIQWAERGTAGEAIAIDEEAWRGRFELLAPIYLCPIVPGEPAPYPSCVEGD